MRTLFIFLLVGIATIGHAQTGTISDGEGGLSVRTKINATITKGNNHADSIVVYRTELDNLADSTDAHRTELDNHADSLDAIVDLYDINELQGELGEGGVSPDDTLVVKSGGTSRKVTKASIYAEAYDSISGLRHEVSVLKDSITELRGSITAIDLKSEFDSIVMNSTNDTIFMYITLISGQVVVPLKIGTNTGPINDNIAPYPLSAEVGNVHDSLIVITMSEYIWRDSVVNYSGSGGGNFDGITNAYNFDEANGFDLDDKVGADDGTEHVTSQGDSTGISGTAYSFVAANENYVLLDNGHNFGSSDFSISVWIKPFSVTSFAIFGDDTDDSFFWRVSNGDMLIGEDEGDYAQTSGLSVTADVWNHCVIVYDQANDSANFFLNGVKEYQSATFTFTAISQYIGSTNATFYSFDGLMDDLFFFDQKILDSTVDSLYNSGAGRRYNESGGGVTRTEDSIKNAFTISVVPLGSAYTVDTVTVTNNKVNLKLNQAIDWGDVVRVAYDAPLSGRLVDSAFNAAVSWNATYAINPITNNVDTSESFAIFETWDFEGEALGHWSDAEIFAYWPDRYEARDHTHNTAQQLWFIVQDSINGTNNLQRKHEYYVPTDSYLLTPEVTVETDSAYDEVYLSFDYRPGVNWNSFQHGKIPGQRTQIGANYTSGTGMIYAMSFTYGGTWGSYVYDHSESWAPWSDAGSYLLIPGNSYRITTRTVLNTFSSGVAQYDGIYEVFIDGKVALRYSGLRNVVDQGDAYKINAFWMATWFGPDQGSTIATCYNYFDNINYWVPLNDVTLGTHNLHGASDSIAVPGAFVNSAFYYDTKISNAAVDLVCPGGGAFPANTNYRWLIDAGAGNTVEVDFDSGTLGTNDVLVFYDGQYTNADQLAKSTGYVSNLGNSWGTSGVVESTGRYMYVVIMSDKGTAFGAFTANITFN